MPGFFYGENSSKDETWPIIIVEVGFNLSPASEVKMLLNDYYDLSPAETAPAVWLGCLAAYNEGHLHGEWVDAMDADALSEAYERFIKTSPALLPEELDLFDCEGVGEADLPWWDAEQCAEVASAIYAGGELLEAVINSGHLCDWSEVVQYPGEVLEAIERAEDGIWPSAEDYAWEQVKDDLPAHLHGYFDLDQYLKDLHGDYLFAECSDGLHVVCLAELELHTPRTSSI